MSLLAKLIQFYVPRSKAQSEPRDIGHEILIEESEGEETVVILEEENENIDSSDDMEQAIHVQLIQDDTLDNLPGMRS